MVKSELEDIAVIAHQYNTQQLPTAPIHPICLLCPSQPICLLCPIYPIYPLCPICLNICEGVNPQDLKRPMTLSGS